MTGDTLPEPPDDRLRKALSEFQDAWMAGALPDPEAFCKKHADCGPDLRNRIENFLYMVGGFPGVDDAILGPEGLKGRVLDDFRILGEIGRGGMGVVYEAEQISLHRRVALKILPMHLSFSDEAVQKFRREAEAGGRQSHPGIASVFAVGRHEGVHYFAQELIQGGRSLAEQLEEQRAAVERPRGYFREAANLVSKVARALAHAHQAGVIHRDVKPSNILLTPDGAPKVTDFGLAKVEDALTLSRSGELAGTPYYMSPEQATSRKGPIDHRTDIYSLGVTLFEMLTLARPFEGESSHEVLKKILFDEPRSPSRLDSRIPRDLSVICLKAMEKNREKRYATMEELAEDLDRFLAGETIRARPAGAVTRTMKRIRRKPAHSAAVALLLLALLTTCILVGEYLLRKQVEREYDAVELLTLSNSLLGTNPGLALLLAIQGARLLSGDDPEECCSPLANYTLLAAIKACREMKTFRVGTVNSVAYSPDGTKLVTASEIMTAAVRDIRDGRPMLLLKGHGRAVNDGVYSPDGRYVLTASDDDTARLFDASSGETVAVLEGHCNEVRHVAISPDGRMALTVSADLTLRIWDLGRAETVCVIVGHAGQVNSAVFSLDGARVLTASDDGAVRTFSADTGEKLSTLFQGDCRALCARYSPCGNRVAAAFADGSVRVWEDTREDPRTLRVPSMDEDNSVLSLAFSSCGTRLAGACSDGTVVVWETTSILEAEVLVVLRGHEAPVTSVAFHPLDRTEVATVSEDHTLRLWKVKRPVEHRGWKSLAFSPDGTKVAMTSQDETVMRVWDNEEEKWLFEAIRFESARFRAGAVSSDGKKLLIATSLYKPWVMDLETGALVKGEIKWKKDSTHLAFSRDDQRIMVGCRAGFAVVYDAKTCREIGRVNHGEDNWVNFIELSNDGEKALTIGEDKIVRLWKFKEGRESLVLDRYGSIQSASISPDGKSVIMVSGHGNAWVLDAVTGEEVRCLFPGKRITKAGFSPVENRIFVAFGDGLVRLMHLDSGETFDLKGHWKNVVQTAFTLSGHRFLTVGEDHMARIWEVLTGNELSSFRYDGEILFASFSPDGRNVVIGFEHGRIETWPVQALVRAEEIKPRDLFPEEIQRFVDPAFAGDQQDHPANPEGWEKRMNALSRDIVLSPRRPCRDYLYAEEYIRTAHLIDHLDPTYSRTYGMVMYRTGEYRECLNTLKAVKSAGAGDRASLAFSAMASWQLGDGLLEGDARDACLKEAEAVLSELERRMRGASQEEEALFEEAASLISRPPTPKPAAYSFREMEPLVFVVSEGKEPEARYRFLLFKPSDPENPEILSDPVPGAVESFHAAFDGKRVAYILKTCGPGSPVKTLEVREIFDGFELGPPRVVYRSELMAGTGLSWHPRGDKLFFCAYHKITDQDPESIVWVDPCSGPEQRPRHLLGSFDESFSWPRISPDGKKICFQHFPGQAWGYGHEIWVADLNEDGCAAFAPKRLTLDQRSDDYCVFAKEGRSVLWASHPAHNLSWLCEVDWASGDRRTLLNTRDTGDGKVTTFSISPSGWLACVFSLRDEKVEGVRMKIFDPGGKCLYEQCYSDSNVTALGFLNPR